MVYGETGASLDTILVDGDVIMTGGALTSIDEAALLEEVAEVHAELEPLIAASERLAEPMVAIYRRIIARCVVHPIATDTYPAKLSSH